MKFRVETRWSSTLQGLNNQNSRIVTASDACEALDSALPGPWKDGQYDRAEISIYRVPDDTPEDA
jgi:hypothetical protein